MTYTLAQISGFTAAAAYDERERERTRAIHLADAMRTAMWADQGDWKNYLDALSGKAPVQLKQGTTTHG